MAAPSIEILAYRLEQAEKEIAALKERDEARDLEERTKLRWGIGVLLGIIASLGGVIWAFRSAILLRGAGS